MLSWNSSSLIQVSTSKALEVQMTEEVHGLSKKENHSEEIVQVGHVFSREETSPDFILIVGMEKVERNKEPKE